MAGRWHWPVWMLVALAAAPAAAADWPQWRGPQRNGVSAETGWLAGWPEGAEPKTAWRAQVGRGHSPVSVSRGRAYTMGWDGKQDTVFCLDAATGKTLWTHAYPCETIDTNPGPRIQPTVEGDRVYVVSQRGHCLCLEAASGKVVWNVVVPFKAVEDEYGFGCSPLVEGDLLILNAGTAGLALDKRTGRLVWGKPESNGPPASAVPYTHQGQRGVVVWAWRPKPGGDAGTGLLLGVDPRDGRELWRYPWPEKYSNTIVDPIVHDGRVFATSGYEYKHCARLVLGQGELKPDWQGNALCSHTGGCVLLDGNLYGVHTESGELRCVDWNTGQVRWAKGGFGKHGTLMAAGGNLIVQTSSTGRVVAVDAAPGGYRELRSARVFEGPRDTFTVPVLAGGRLYCRSYKGEVVCLDMTARR